MQRLLVLSIALAATLAAQNNSPRIFNTVKTKLAQGKQVIGGTVSSSDPDIYCAMANAGFDFTWIEMQHSPLSYSEVAKMVYACRGASAMPFIRVPDDSEGDIQKATDLGAAGIIVPMVDSMEKIRNAIKFAKYPPLGKRSQGGGNYGAIWGSDYRGIANDNIMVIAMIESPAGVDLAEQLAMEPGVDVIFVASTDLGSFTGLRQGDPKYEALVTRVHDAVLKHGKILAGPLAWRERHGYKFFQAPGESAVIRTGAASILKGAPEDGAKKGVAVIEGSEKK
ncbi:MAG: hypothetical protein FJW38_28495 [Acidobacteria bacterium]|nr:hypothetical protein [Acidobacteriota bacterium]